MSNFTNDTVDPKFSEFYLCFNISGENYFLGLSSEIFFGVITDNLLHLVILVQGFCPLKIEITQFPDGFRLKCLRLSLCVSHNL